MDGSLGPSLIAHPLIRALLSVDYLSPIIVPPDFHPRDVGIIWSLEEGVSKRIVCEVFFLSRPSTSIDREMLGRQMKFQSR